MLRRNQSSLLSLLLWTKNKNKKTATQKQTNTQTPMIAQNVTGTRAYLIKKRQTLFLIFCDNAKLEIRNSCSQSISLK